MSKPIAWVDSGPKPSFALHPECADDVTVDYGWPDDGERIDDCGNTILAIYRAGTLRALPIECCEVCDEPLADGVTA